MKAGGFVRIVIAAIMICICGNNFARADSLAELIASAVEDHDRLLGSRAEVEAARQRSLESLGIWYPNLNVSANIERYKLERSETRTVILPGQEVTGTISQLLWDFGAGNAAIERSRLVFTQAEIGLVQTRQDLTAEALAAYINLIRSYEIVGFARRSEENIRRQTGLEEARIDAGSGLSTDLLQAKTQLAGAQARRVDAEGGYELALNRYRAVFGEAPGNIDSLPGIEIDRTMVPTTLDDALDQAFSGNPQIRLISLDISIAQQDRIARTAEGFAPTFEVVGEQTMQKNDAGTVGRRNESSIKLQLSFPFNLGFTSINTLRAAQSDEVAASRRMGDLERTIEERVRNAWKQLETARLRSGYLFDQAGIARAFLEVAIQERSLGQRSLIDVLAGETSLINAQSDAIAAEAEVLLAIVELLSAAGTLEYDVILTVPRPDRSEMLAPIAGLSDTGARDPVMDLLDPNAADGVLDPSSLMTAPTDGSGSIFAPPTGELQPPAELDAPEEPGTEETPGGLQDSLQAPPSFDTPASTLFPDAPLSPIQPSDTAIPLPRPEPAAQPDRVDVAPEEPAAQVPEGPVEQDPPPADSSGLDNPLFDWAR